MAGRVETSPVDPRTAAEARLAHALRGLGVERGRAALMAEANGHRLTVHESGDVCVTVIGDAAVRWLAADLLRGASSPDERCATPVT